MNKKKMSVEFSLTIIGIFIIVIGVIGGESAKISARIILILLGLLFISAAMFKSARWAVGALYCVAMTLMIVWFTISSFLNPESKFSIGDIIFSVIIIAALLLLAVYCFKKIKRLHSYRTIAQIDTMDGLQFEHFCAELLEKSGFRNVEVTKASGDQGVDILATKGKDRYAIQCKRYSSDLDNTPVQEVFTGKSYYGCTRAAVMTNSYFTTGAKELANATGVLLWDRDWILQRM